MTPAFIPHDARARALCDLSTRSKGCFLVGSMVETLNGTQIIRSTPEIRKYHNLTLIRLIGGSKI